MVVNDVLAFLDSASIEDVYAIRLKTRKLINSKNNALVVKKKQVYSWDMTMAKGMHETIKASYPLIKQKSTADLEDWADYFRKMREIDGYSQDLIFTITEFALKDSFWKKVILSPSNLRSKFERLMAQKASGNNVI